MSNPKPLYPIANKAVSRPKPTYPDRLMRLQEFIDISSDIACWKADKAEAMLSGVYES